MIIIYWTKKRKIKSDVFIIKITKSKNTSEKVILKNILYVLYLENKDKIYNLL